MGDGALVEFASVIDALACAAEVQSGMAERNRQKADGPRITFRIGINLGDVIVEGDDLYGDGVNVASRLEGLAEPGGICISAKVYDEVKNKLALGYEDMGEQEVKNVAEPIHVYLIVPERSGEKPTAEADVDLALPDKPSIAVLPFDNMSGDPEQEFFADGITEDLITALSKIRWFFVIARNSTYTYKGKAVEVTQVAKELGVRYVVGGQRTQSGQPRTRHRPVDRRDIRPTRLGRELRPANRGYLRPPGRDEPDHRRGRGAGAFGRGAGPRTRQAAGEPGRLGELSARSLAHVALRAG
jgi:adenylate cyclase